MTYAERELLIRGGRVLRNADSSIEPEASILARDGTIVAIGREAEDVAQSSAEILDLKPCVLIPGLIDSHVHLIWSGGSDALFGAVGLSRSELTVQAIVNMQAALSMGITTVRDCGGIADVTIPLARAVEEGRIIGPTIVASGSAITTTGGHCWFLEFEADGEDEVVKSVRRLHKLGAHFIKVMVTGGGSTPGSNPRASQYSFEELAAISRDAHRLELGVTGHAHGTEGILNCIDAGFDGIEHCTWLAREGEGEDYRDEAVGRIADRGIYVCKTVAGFQRWPLEELNSGHRAWREFETMRRMVDSGVTFIAGTDAGISRTDFRGLCRTIETMVGLGGMTPRNAFRSATEVASLALGRADSVGSLAVGKRADIVAVDDDPTEDIRTLRSPRAVVKNGRLAARDGHLIV